jgi:hypothetical protein
MPALPTYAQASSTAIKEDPAHEQHSTLSHAATSTSVAEGLNTVHVVHATILTFLAKNGVEVFTAIYGPAGTSLIDEETTIPFTEVQITSNLLPASFDPGRGCATSQQLATVNGAVFTIDTISKGGFELIGHSTTMCVHQDHPQTTRTVGHLALATGASSSTLNAQSPGFHSSPIRGRSSAPSSGLHRALTTCVYLSLLAMFMAMFM